MIKELQKTLAGRVLLLVALLMSVGVSRVEAAPGDPAQASQPVTSYVGPRLARASDGSLVMVSIINRNSNPANRDVLAQRFDAAGAAVGPEFRVNTAEAAEREDVEIAMAPDGRFVVAWRERFTADGAQISRLFARRFNAAGASQGQPFRLHTPDAQGDSAAGGRQSFNNTQVQMDAQGNFVTTWLHQNGNGSNGTVYTIEARRWAADGTAQGAEFVVESNTRVPGANPIFAHRLAMRPSGEFAIAYDLFRDDDGQIVLKRYDAQGAAQGNAITVANGLAGLRNSNATQAFAMSVDGRMAVLWDVNRRRVMGQRLSSDGSQTGPAFALFAKDFSVGGFSTVARLDDAGNLVAMATQVVQSFSGSTSVFVYMGRPDGSAYARPFRLLSQPPAESNANTEVTDLVLDADGDALAVFRIGGFNTSNFRRFSRPAEAVVASALTPPLKVNTYPVGTITGPSIALNALGEKFYNWTSSLRDNGAPGIYSQRFSFDGNSQTNGETRLNVLTPEAEADAETLALQPGFYLTDRYTLSNTQVTAAAWRKTAVDDEGPAGVLLDLKRVDSFSALPVQQLSIDAASGSPALAYAQGRWSAVSDLSPTDLQLVAAWREGGAASGGAVKLKFYQRAVNEQNRVDSFDREAIAATGSALPTTVDVAMASLGESVVVWSGRAGGDTADQIYAQRYDRTFTAVGTPIRVSTAAASSNRLPKVDMTTAGAFVVSWVKGSGPAARIAARRFDVAGTALGDELTLGAAPPDSKAPGVALDFDGDAVIAWLEGDSDVVFQQLRRTGEALGGVVSAISGTGLSGPFTGIGVDANEDGDFSLAFNTAASVYSRSYTVTADLAPLPLPLSTYSTSTAISPNNVQPSTPVTLTPMLNVGSFETCGNSLLNTKLPAAVVLRSVDEQRNGLTGWSCTTVDSSTLSCTGVCGGYDLMVTAPSRPGRYRIATNAVVANGRDGATVQDAGTSNLVVLGPANGTLLFRSSEAMASESVGTLNLLVDRINGSEGAVSIAYATANGTAMAGSDYTATSGMLTWAANDAQPKNIAIPITPDTAVEGEETFTVTLSNATGGAASGVPDQVTVKLSDAQLPGSLVFSAASYTVAESGPTATITVNRTGGASGAASVAYASSNGTATAGQDYTTASGTLTWADGDAAAKTFTVAISNDPTPEADETVSLALSNATGATLGSPSMATLTITNDDGTGPGTLAFSASSYAGSEAASGRMVSISVNRSGGGTSAASVAYTTSNGTAAAPQDYTTASGTLNWAADDTAAKSFVVTIIDDTVAEPSETVTLTLSNATGAALGTPSTATLNIADDDQAGPDTTPDPFTFIDQINVATNTEIVSNTVTVAGINAAAAISVAGGEYRIDGGAFTSAAGTVGNGQTVQLRHTSSATLNTTVNTTLTIGGVSDVFSSTTAAVADTTPDAFSFRDQTGVPANATITSNAVLITGINSPAAISVSGTGGSYRIDGGAFVTTAGSVRSGQLVQVRHTSSPLPNQTTDTTLTVGGVSDTFTSTTGTLVQADTTPNAFDFTDPVGVPRSTAVVSNTITVGGINTSTAISITGGEYSVDAGPFVSYSSTVLNGQTVRVRHVSAAGFNAQTTTTLTIGGVNSAFISTTESSDTAPDAFSFTDVTVRVEPLSVVVSNTLTLTGFNASAAVTVTGGEYSIGCTATFTSQAGSINAGQSVCVRHTASSVFGALNETELTVGGVVGRFTSRTREGDSTPDAYSFVDQSNVALSTVITSAPITIRGIEVASLVRVTGGQYSLGCAANGYTAADGMVTANQTICLRHTSSSLPGTATNTTLTVGGVSDVFTSITVGGSDTTPDAFSFTDRSNAAVGAVVVSNTLTITGLTAAASIQVTGGEYSIGCQAAGFTRTAGTISNGQSVCVRHTAGSGPGITVNTTLTIGGVSDVFSSTTAPDANCPANDAPVFETTAPPAVELDTELSYTLRVRSPTGGSVTVNALGLPSCISLLGNGVDPGSFSLSGLVGVGCAVGDFTVRLRAQSASGCSTDLSLPISLLSGDRREVTDFIGRLVRVVTNTGQLQNLESLDAATQPVGSLPGFSYPQGFFRSRIADVTPRAGSAPQAKLAVGGVANLSFGIASGEANSFVSCSSTLCQELPVSAVQAGVLTVQLQDGGAGDTDGRADGVITMNGAPARKAGSNGPVFVDGGSGGGGGSWGLAGLLLLPLGLWRRRQARAISQ